MSDHHLDEAKQKAREEAIVLNSCSFLLRRCVQSALDRAVEIGAEAEYKTLSKYIQAVGFITAALAPDQEVDAADPMRMCGAAVEEVTKLRARVEELEQLIKETNEEIEASFPAVDEIRKERDEAREMLEWVAEHVAEICIDEDSEYWGLCGADENSTIFISHGKTFLDAIANAKADLLAANEVE